jgi:hypothetical protein
MSSVWERDSNAGVVARQDFLAVVVTTTGPPDGRQFEPQSTRAIFAPEPGAPAERLSPVPAE